MTVADEKVDKLKPCPFCGGKAVAPIRSQAKCVNPKCAMCAYMMHDSHWNTRPTLPLFDVEAVVREIEELDEIGWGTEFCDCGISYPTYSPRKKGFGTHIRKADVLSILRRHSEKGATK